LRTQDFGLYVRTDRRTYGDMQILIPTHSCGWWGI